MKFIADDITLQMIDNRPHICFRFPASNIAVCRQVVEDAKKFISQNPFGEISIKKRNKHRSLDANAYMWVLCQKIAKKLSSKSHNEKMGIVYTKEDIYKKLIRDVGEFTIVPIKNEAVETYIRKWSSRGTGWLAESMGECKKTPGYTNVVTYFGSSSYDTFEMSRLIDGVVQDAKSLNIETATPEQLALMKEEWK